MSQKWICNKCGYERTEKPKHKNETCKNCNKGRFQVWNRCECGEWFHPQRIDQKYCSKECMYKYRETGGKKGKKYPHTQRARIVVCPVCGKEFRAIQTASYNFPFITQKGDAFQVRQENWKY